MLSVALLTLFEKFYFGYLIHFHCHMPYILLKKKNLVFIISNLATYCAYFELTSSDWTSEPEQLRVSSSMVQCKIIIIIIEEHNNNNNKKKL